MAELQPKLIYVARRNPAMTRAQFTPRWRQHGALGMSMPRWKNIARYVHCDAIEPPRATAVLDTVADGVGIVWHRSEAARAAHIADTSSRAAMERDELETFAEPVVAFCCVTLENVMLATRDPAARFKITRLAGLRDSQHGPDLAQFRVRTASALLARLQAAGVALRAHVVSAPMERPGGGRWGLDVDCVEEFWFDTVDAAVTGAEQLAADAVSEVELGAPPTDSRLILTNEVVLYQI